jgi:glycosyltransferase involved in cell wall biosynthesis
MIDCSILISSFNRLPLFRRTLWSIATRPPSIPFEVVVCDDGSTEDTLGELKKFSSRFAWKFIRFSSIEFEAATGLKKFFNCPAATNNVAFRHASGNLIFQQGNEVIAWADVYNRLIQEMGEASEPLVMSTTYDLPHNILDRLDEYGSNLNESMVREAWRWPLQSIHYRSDVTNYISLAPRSLWERIGGYDERYFGGICAEDSDFVRRARALDGFKQVISEGVSLHQNHFGKSCYQNPKPTVITRERFEEGCRINRAIYDLWDGSPNNPQQWPIGEYGVGEVITNMR